MNEDKTQALKVVHISASDRVGGAAVAAFRLHESLRQQGIDSHMLVLRKVSHDAHVHRLALRMSRWGRAQRRLGAWRHRRRLAGNPREPGSVHWSLNSFRYPIAGIINDFAADVVNLHWVGDNFLPLSELTKIRAPIVWTLHDMWAFTGGCHLARSCEGFMQSCGHCPQLVRSAEGDISRQLLRKKQRLWAGMPLTIACPSQWLADCARRSSTLQSQRIEVLGNPAPSQRYKALDRALARQAFNLPSEQRLLLFGAVGGTSDQHKGFHLLRQALEGMPADGGLQLLIFGGSGNEALDLPLPARQTGHLHDEQSLSLLYAACDVYILPSLQENLPNVLLEALTCGTPCVAFDGSGVPDIIQHKRNGYLARLGDVADLQRGIEWTLAQSWDRQALRADIIRRYGEARIAQQYIELYRSLLADG